MHDVAKLYMCQKDPFKQMKTMDFNVMRYKTFVPVVSAFTCQLTFSKATIYRLVVSKSSQLFERLLTISPFSKYLPVKIQVASLLKPKQDITTG